MITRFRSIESYIYYRLLEKAKLFGVQFIFFTVGQIIIFTMYDPNFNLLLLLYRNSVFYTLIMIVYSFVLLGNEKYRFRRKCILFVMWNTVYLSFILLPNSMINFMNIFVSLIRVDVAVIIKFVLCYCVLLVFQLMQFKRKKGYIETWLE